jgi:hypothetical protein
MYIKNRRDGSKFKRCSPLQPQCHLIMKWYAIAYFSYTHRYTQSDQYLIVT